MKSIEQKLNEQDKEIKRLNALLSSKGVNVKETIDLREANNEIIRKHNGAGDNSNSGQRTELQLKESIRDSYKLLGLSEAEARIAADLDPVSLQEAVQRGDKAEELRRLVLDPQYR